MNNIEKLEEGLNRLKVEVAIQSQQIKSMAEKVDMIHDDFKDLRQSLIGDLKTSNEWWRSTAFKVFVALAGFAGGGMGINELLKLFGG